MKIAAIAYHFAEYTFRLMSSIAEQPDMEVHLWFPEQRVEPYRRWLSPAVKTHFFFKPRLREPIYQLRVTRQILRQVGALNPDIIHVQNGNFWFNFGLPFARRYPLIITIHDLVRHPGDSQSNKTPQFVMEFGFRQAHHLVVHSQRIKDAAAKRLDMQSDRIHVVPHLALGKAQDPSANASIPPRQTVLFFGRIYPYKGLEYLIKAQPLVTQALPDTRFIIAGTGEDFQKYRNMMVNPEQFVVYNEFIPEDEIETLFRQASVVALPYVEASQSGVIAHAHTFSKPVVATTVGGLPDAIDPGETGLLVAPRDEKALAQALIELLRDPQRCREMGLRGRHKIDTIWSPQTVAQQTIDVYRAALTSHGRSRA